MGQTVWAGEWRVLARRRDESVELRDPGDQRVERLEALVVEQEAREAEWEVDSFSIPQLSSAPHHSCAPVASRIPARGWPSAVLAIQPRGFSISRAFPRMPL